MIRKILCLSTFLLTFTSLSIQAGQLYRFPDENGVLTLSRSLPPEAAPRGYDILDDRNMRLIERIPPAPTKEEIAEMKAEQAREAERQRQAEIAAKEAEKARETRARYDRSLLMTFPTEADLIDARDRDIGHREEQIATLSAKLPKLQQNLEEVQKEAAERELSGGSITANMQKRLDAAHQEIAVREQAIENYQNEIKQLTAKYQADLERLRLLRGHSNDKTP